MQLTSTTWVFFAASIALVLVAGLLLRRRRVGEHPHCRGCEFDLHGLPAEAGRCPECGRSFDLKHRKSFQIGLPRRRRWHVAAGVLLILLSLSLGGRGVQKWAATVDFVKESPTWVLLQWATRTDDLQQRDRLLAELMYRDSNHILSHRQIVSLAETLLAFHADAFFEGGSGSYHPAMVMWREKGILDDELWDRYVVSQASVELRVRNQIDSDMPAIAQLDYGVRPLGRSFEFRDSLKPVLSIECTIDGQPIPQIRQGPTPIDLTPLNLTPGNHILNATVTFDATAIDPLSTRPPIVVQQRRRFTILPPGQESTRWKRDPVLAKQLEKQLQCLLTVPDDETLSLRVSHFPHNTNLCHDVFVRTPLGEEKIDTIVYQLFSNLMLMPEFDLPKVLKGQQTADVIFRPSREAGKRALQRAEWLDETIVLKDVAIGGTGMPRPGFMPGGQGKPWLGNWPWLRGEFTELKQPGRATFTEQGDSIIGQLIDGPRVTQFDISSESSGQLLLHLTLPDAQPILLPSLSQTQELSFDNRNSANPQRVEIIHRGDWMRITTTLGGKTTVREFEKK